LGCKRKRIGQQPDPEGQTDDVRGRPGGTGRADSRSGAPLAGHRLDSHSAASSAESGVAAATISRGLIASSHADSLPRLTTTKRDFLPVISQKLLDELT